MVGGTLADPAEVLAAVGLRSGMNVIDLCSGDGWFTLQIAKVARHVSAIDIDPHFLEVAQHRLAENGVTNCAFIAGDAYNIAKVAAPADFVFMANAFHGVPDRSRLAQAVGSALKADGYFAIVNWHKRPREETPILGEPRGPKTEWAFLHAGAYAQLTMAKSPVCFQCASNGLCQPRAVRDARWN